MADFPREGLPLFEPAEVLFDDHQLPFIIVRDDRDAPLAMGLVHAHLRLAQMELLRCASQGRLSELFGPFMADVDHGLRLLDLDRAVPAMERSLPPETRAWIERYVEGINAYKKQARRLAPEVEMYGVAGYRWKVSDVLALGRLAGADVNWLFWSSLLPLRHEPGFPELWERLLAAGAASPDQLAAGPGAAPGMAARSGSNAFAVAGDLSGGKGPVLACDTHVGLMLPNLWLAVAIQAPTLNVAGLCLPGLPVVLVGRNMDAAWGGTNMLALSSTLYDVSDMAPDAFFNRSETLRIRWWPDQEAVLPQTSLGPLISEAPQLQDKGLCRLALKWRGHEPSRELTAFLALNRARNWEEFRAALDGYAVSGQNLVYADRTGRVGRVMAWERIPAAGRAALELVGDPAEEGHRWSERKTPGELPAIVDPPTEMILSANDVPAGFDPPASLFGYPSDRLARMDALIRELAPVGLAEAEAVQQDVLQPSALTLARAVADRASREGAPPGAAGLVERLAAWDGRYDVHSTGAAALEQTAYHLVDLAYGERYGDKLAEYLLGSPAVYRLLAEDAPKIPRKAFHEGLAKASEDNMQYETWGEMHKLVLSHPLGQAPVIGGRFRFGKLPWPGGMNTIWKSAHGIAPGVHEVRYGANARLVTDLGEPSVRVCLLGGQDGFLGGPNFMDQVGLWREGKYLDLPLRARDARRTFKRRIVLAPGEQLAPEQ
ncbi:MAG: penicillin acylase family protein [Desulfovibrionaceae bacterium]